MSSITRLANVDLNKVLLVLATLMDVVWSYAWLIWISSWATFHWDKPPLNLISCIILGIGTGILNRFSTGRDWPVKRKRWVVITGSLLLLAILLRWSLSGGYSLNDIEWFSYAGRNLSQVLAGFFFGLYITWRGISASRPKYRFNEIYRQFAIGLAAIIVLLVIWNISGTQLGAIWSSAGSYVMAYFGLGLLALAVTSLENLRMELLHHHEAASSFKGRWLSMMVVMILGILGISAAISYIFNGNGVQKVIHFLSILGNWLYVALTYILLPLGYLIQGLIYVGRWLISLLGTQTKPTPPNFGEEFKKAAEGQPPVPIPEPLLLILKWGGLALVIGLALFFLARTLIRYWDSKNEEEVEEVHETFWSWAMFGADLRHFLGWLFRWVHRRKKVTSENILPPTPLAAGNDDNDSIFNIRELYKAMLWQGRQIGIPRRKSETPYEYRQNLESRLNMPKDEIDALTEAYVTDRYGLVNPTPQKVTLLNRIWRNLRQKIINREDDY